MSSRLKRPRTQTGNAFCARGNYWFAHSTPASRAFPRNHSLNRRRLVRLQAGGPGFCRRFIPDRFIEAFRADPAQVIDCQVARQREEPSLEISVGIVLLNLFRYAYPRGLEKVLRLRWLPHPAEHRTLEPVLISCDQRRQRLQIPSPKLCYVAFQGHSAVPGHCRAAHHIGTTAKPPGEDSAFRVSRNLLNLGTLIARGRRRSGPEVTSNGSGTTDQYI